MTDISRERNPAGPKRVAIVQSNYIPWKGYFDLIDSVDHFVLLDSVQFTRRDWRNRNRIKSKSGLVWLTIPVITKGRYTQRICDVEVSDATWSTRHLNRISECYSRAPCFHYQLEYLRELYAHVPPKWLSDVNQHLLRRICQRLGITTTIWQSMDLEHSGGRTGRLVELCRKLGATEYVSGPSAKAYLEEHLFHQEGITVSYFDYEGFTEYPQLYPPFEHCVSIIDALISLGPNAPSAVLRRGQRRSATLIPSPADGIARVER